MQRIFWGLVKIAVVVVLIVWGSRSFFTETSTGEAELLETPVDISEDRAVLIEGKENTLLVRSDMPKTEQQKRYAEYALKAGSPSSFSGTLQVRSTEPLSSQLARAFGEPEGEWTNLSVHKKTFWVLSELSLRNINVDAVSSVRGAIIEVENGILSIDLSSISQISFSAPVSVVSVVPPLLNAGEMNSSIPPQKTSRRMSARSWEKVLEAGTR